MSNNFGPVSNGFRGVLTVGFGFALVATGVIVSYTVAAGGAGTKAGNPHHGAKVAMAHCAACHGADGNSTDPRYPKLAGQRAAYLYGELWAFKEGQRRSRPMQAVVASLADADLADVSAYYATRIIHPDPATMPGLARAGGAVYYGGRPSCAMCHQGGGMPMMQMMGGGAGANAPRLAGQHARYTLAQLDAFASGRRHGTVMNQIASSLDEAERKAVADYLSQKR